MAYDEGLAERLHDYFQGRPEVEVKKMFGGLCFMVGGHMCCGIVGDTLMARVGPERYEARLTEPHAREMDFTGRAMKGMIYVAPEGIEDDAELARWIGHCEEFVRALPPKSPKKKSGKKAAGGKRPAAKKSAATKSAAKEPRAGK